MTEYGVGGLETLQARLEEAAAEVNSGRDQGEQIKCACDCSLSHDHRLGDTSFQCRVIQFQRQASVAAEIVLRPSYYTGYLRLASTQLQPLGVVEIVPWDVFLVYRGGERLRVHGLSFLGNSQVVQSHGHGCQVTCVRLEAPVSVERSMASVPCWTLGVFGHRPGSVLGP